MDTNGIFFRDTDNIRVIKIDSLNILSGQAGGLGAELQALQQGNFRIIVLKETNLTRVIHMQYRVGHILWAMEL